MTFAEVATIAGYVIVIGGAIAAIWGGGKWMIGTLKKVNEFLEDWRGEEPRAGYPGRLVDLEDRLKIVEHESVPNSGSSMKDAVSRIDKAVPGIVDRLTALEAQATPRAPQDGTQAVG
jgi:hypothetical protein